VEGKEACIRFGEADPRWPPSERRLVAACQANGVASLQAGWSPSAAGTAERCAPRRLSTERRSDSEGEGEGRG